MIYLGIALVILSISFFIYNIKKNNKAKQELDILRKNILDKEDNRIKQELKQKQDELMQQTQALQAKYLTELRSIELNHNQHITNLESIKKLEEEKYHIEIKNLQDKINELDILYKNKREEYNSFLETSLDSVNAEIARYREVKTESMDKELAVIHEERIAKKKEEFANFEADYESRRLVMLTDLETVRAELDDFKKKQEALNKEIMRRREVEEKQDFYRICIDKEVEDDISILSSIRKNLKKPEIIDKIIYDNYVSKPLLEMIKRVLSNQSFSGIYKITCLKTGEIYIGKSTDIKNRFQQHVKTVYNCGSIAQSLLHTKMKKYGIENFTFEVLERVEKEHLSEKEKYYIEFYASKEVGLNERNG